MDDFREWLSDNLRYFMLGGIILIVVLILIFSIRGCRNRRQNPTTGEEVSMISTQTGTGINTQASSGTQSTGNTVGIANPLVQASTAVTDLVTRFYKAIDDADFTTLRSLVSDLSAEEEQRISSNPESVQSRTVKNVYTKNGPSAGTYVTYAEVDVKYQNYNAVVPMLSYVYIYTDASGSLKIDGAASSKSDIQSFINSLKTDEDIRGLATTIEAARNAIFEDPANADLKSFAQGLSSGSGNTVAVGEQKRVTDDVNVRAQPSSNAQVLTVLDSGSAITKTGESGEWTQIDYNGQVGYVYSQYVQ